MTGDSIAGPTGGNAAQRATTSAATSHRNTGIAAAAREAAGAYERMETPGVTIDDVRSPLPIAPYIHRTPLFDSATLSRLTGTRLGLKAENLQRTGAFKARRTQRPSHPDCGATRAGCHHPLPEIPARVLPMPPRSPRCAASFSCRRMPSHQGGGGQRVRSEARFAPSMETVFAAMDEYRDAHGMHYVHPFGDPDIIAGQGTVGLEIMEDSPDVETIAVCGRRDSSPESPLRRRQ